VVLECCLEGAEQHLPSLDGEDHTPKIAQELVPLLGGDVLLIVRDAG